MEYLLILLAVVGLLGLLGTGAAYLLWNKLPLGKGLVTAAKPGVSPIIGEVEEIEKRVRKRDEDNTADRALLADIATKATSAAAPGVVK